MFDDYQICPYTGLRSFTEEESLYFKGREDHIQQATEQLQRNKFLMLTGASGDGKSSLVYAGIIPNARAGFLKAKYTQWCVADFRPERTPFKNLCKAVGRQLGIANPDTVESELHHGFSALADLYKNSQKFTDHDSIAWKTADESGKAALKREAANLIILVDQFEEFFTNPENYHAGVPSRDSNLTLNVLLETARIALEENLPIYVVFTMRSDYIGQCAAFRSLPEYIGFSQFFVPRLNRSQLQQVIEEPATLSGNKISRRLTERLIHDVAEGVDQLPILQHALNQIWHSANQGSEEMDLIHYAMVGGMSSSELPDDQVGRFSKWFDLLPEKIKQFYREPNLQNVLDTHANKLYESAADSYRSKTGKELSDENAKTIVKTAFICLTKIDQSRAVRNRMTLLEVVHVLGRPELDSKVVGGVLNIFREPGNTFIRPFVTDEPESQSLTDADVLDITHESLIRNWELLGAWAKEEFDNYSISIDFEKQLDRWVESGKDKGFLLSIGPLTYFESWYGKLNPNAWWIARYLPEDIDQSRKLEKATVVLDNARQFLKGSARKHTVTRAIIRYGPRRIAAVLAIIGFLTLSSFMVRNYFRQQNSYVLQQIKEKSLELTNSKKASSTDITFLIFEQLKSGNLTLDEIDENVKDTIKKINLPARLAADLVGFGRSEPRKEISQSLSIAESHIRAYPIQNATTKQLKVILKEVNYTSYVTGLASIYNPSVEILELRRKMAENAASIVKTVLSRQPSDFKDINRLNVALENGINHKMFSNEELDWLLKTLSPFENGKRSEWVLTNYLKDNVAPRSTSNYAFKFNGLFQELAYLYASRGDADKALQCTDSLLFYNQNYYQSDYSSMQDNATNVATVFYTYGEQEALDVFVKGYCVRKKITEIEFYQRWIARSLAADPIVTPLFEFGDGLMLSSNCQLSNDKTLIFLFNRYRKVINDVVKVMDERNYLLALSYKDEAMVRYNLLNLSHRTEGRDSLFSLFDKAVEVYKQVSPAFLQASVMTTTTSDNDAKLTVRKYLFLYPDYRTTFAPFEPRNFFYYYSSSFFVEYLTRKNLIDTYYDDESIGYIATWVDALQATVGIYDGGASAVRSYPDPKVLIDLELVLATRKTLAGFNMLYLILGNAAAEQNMPDRMMYYYSQLDKDKMNNLLTSQSLSGQAFIRLAYCVRDFCALDSFKRAYPLVKIFKNAINRSSLYAFAAKELLLQKKNTPVIQQLIDSARAEMVRVDNNSGFEVNRGVISYALALQNGGKNLEDAYAVVKNFPDKKLPSLQVCRSLAFHGNLYGAQQEVISNISDGNMAEFLWNILYGHSRGAGSINPEWESFTTNFPFFATNLFFYTNEN